MQSQWSVDVRVRKWPGGRASDYFQPATLVVDVARDGEPAARGQYLLRGRTCAVEPWPGARTYGVWPQVLFTVEDGERAEIWVDRPLPSQDDELLLRGRYVAGRGEIESAVESGRVEVMIARALFEALAQLHDVPADLPEGTVEFVAAPGEGRGEGGNEEGREGGSQGAVCEDADGGEAYSAFGAWHVRAGDEMWRAVEVEPVLEAEEYRARARRYQVWRDGDLAARWRVVRSGAGARVWAGQACAEVDDPLSEEQVAELPGPVRALIEALPGV